MANATEVDLLTGGKFRLGVGIGLKTVDDHLAALATAAEAAKTISG